MERTSVQSNQNSFSSDSFRFFCDTALQLRHTADESIHLTVTSPPYWNSIDYDLHAANGESVWHRKRDYQSLGDSFHDYLDQIEQVFTQVLRVTCEGGFCAIVVGTILHDRKHYAAPMHITDRLVKIGWEFHQDIIWNKVTGGVKRAGVFIKHPKFGYFYPNIMTEYVLVLRKPGAFRRGVDEEVPIDDLFKRDIANNIWHIAPVPPKSIAHPCPYPEELVRRLVLLYSGEQDCVLDPFLGSGQTALAAIRLNRYCVGYDIEPTYVQLAEQRLEKLPSERKFNLIPSVQKLQVGAKYDGLVPKPPKRAKTRHG